MARRFCGNVTIDLRYRDRGGGYDCRVVTPVGTMKIAVSEPAVLTHAVDSPESYDSAAHAALSFAIDVNHRIADEAALGIVDGKYHITRKKEQS